MIDIYIDDVRVKTIGLSDGKHNLILEAKSDKENKAQILFDDEELKTLYILSKNRCEVQGLIPVYNTISSTGDVEKVRHGKWLNFLGDWSTAECDKCGETYETTDREPNEELFNAFRLFYKYCPNCGAKMDKEN